MDSSPTSRELTLDSRLAVIQGLLFKSADRIVKRGAQRETANKFDISSKTVHQYWKRYHEKKPEEDILNAIRSRKSGYKGHRKRDGAATQKNELKIIDDVITYVKKEFDIINPWSLNDVFLSLFKDTEASMAVDGGIFTRSRI